MTYIVVFQMATIDMSDLQKHDPLLWKGFDLSTDGGFMNKVDSNLVSSLSYCGITFSGRDPKQHFNKDI